MTEQMIRHDEQAGATVTPAAVQQMPEAIPAVDILENADAFVLQLDVPGVDPQSIDVTNDRGVLTIRGAVAHRPQATWRPLLREFRPVEFRRTFRIGNAIDTEAIRASCAGGVLTIELPKTKAARARRIEITAA